MSALTQPRDTPFRPCHLVPVPVAKGEAIPMGAIVCINSTGYAVNGSADATLRFAGCADESVDNTDGADGAQFINVRANMAFKWLNDGTITQSNMLSHAYVLDNQTLTATDGSAPASDDGKTDAVAASNPTAGKVILIEDDGVWIY